MTGWLEVATIAFVAQLTVLPGEKAQFVVAALSTRFHPLVVVAAAVSAFAGWTALEVRFGNYLQQTLSPLVLDALTGLLFLSFAVLLYRSAPSSGEAGVATDGGLFQGTANDIEVRVPVVDWRVPNALGGFAPIFVLMAVGEFGDKTQLVTIGLAAQYAHGTAIWAGEMAAIVPVSLANALFFYRFSNRFDLREAHFASAVLFAFFGVDTLQANLTGVSVWESIVTGVGSVLTVVVSLA